MLSGFSFIAEVVIYWHTGEKVFCKIPDAELQTNAQFTQSLSNLYSYILEYQSAVVCHPNKRQLSRAINNVFTTQDWPAMTQKVTTLHASCKDLLDITSRLDIYRINEQSLGHLQSIASTIEQGQKQTREHYRNAAETALLHDLASPYESFKDFNRKRVAGRVCGFSTMTGIETGAHPKRHVFFGSRQALVAASRCLPGLLLTNCE